MLVIENCNSLSDLRQKLIDGEEVRTVRQEPCKGAISRAKALEAIKKLPHARWLVSTESVLNVLSDLPPVTPLEQEPCEDVIRREDALQALCNAVHKNDDTIPCSNQIVSCLWSKTKVQDYAREIYKLPSVNSQPKTGHWINIDATHSKCDRCEAVFEIVSENGEVNYCPNCGAKMIEPQESEDKCKNCEYYRNPDYTRCHECKAESEVEE